jgi:hypothetical protein
MTRQNKKLFCGEEEYLQKVYAGILGKVIGVRHGADIEGWTYDEILYKYGEVSSYIRNYQKNFAADDDTNGFTFFIRAVEDYSDHTPREMGLTWLNYIPDRHGFLWWGGYGISTEQTAYENLSNQIDAPYSGSADQNGKALAEQIGGQIFSDIWGLVCPGDPQKAAELAEKMSSVSHDGEGIYGGQFIASCTAAAFQEQDMYQIIKQGLSVVPRNSEFHWVIERVVTFYSSNPSDWRRCFHFIKENFGYSHYPGPVPIIPNAAVVVLALLYGDGDYGKTINIANMCGWDTDCNTGNAGTILAVRNGLEGIHSSWRDPVHDFIACSSVLGSLNMVDIPNFAHYVALLSCKLYGITPPVEWKFHPKTYHFELPGSTHSFQTECDDPSSKVLIKNTDKCSYSGKRSLKLQWNNIQKDARFRTFVKTYYSPLDFDDSRMDPAFSPILYPGQTITTTIRTNEKGVYAKLFIFEKNKQTYYYGKQYLLSKEWETLTFQVPFLESACIEKAGIELTIQYSTERSLTYYIDSFSIGGKANYSILFKDNQIEKWNSVHHEISQMTYLRGIWTLEDRTLVGRYNGLSAECYTGDVYWKNYQFSSTLIPQKGFDHLILFRVQGGIRCYAFGLGRDNTIVFYKKNERGFHTLKTFFYEWRLGESIEFTIKASVNQFDFWVNDKYLFCYQEENMPYLNGSIGFANMNASITAFEKYTLKEL